MKRTLSFLLASQLWLATASPLMAQGWTTDERGEGFYISWWKLPLFWVLFLLWVKAASWVNRAGTRLTQTTNFNNLMANTAFTLSFAAGMLLFVFVLPIPGIAGFAVSFPVLLIAFIVAVMTFASHFNGLVLETEKVFTSEHLKFWFTNLGKKTKVEREVRHAYELGADVDFSATASPDKNEQQSLVISSRQSLGYVQAKEIVAGAIDRRAERLMLDYTAQGVGTRYEIDGMWVNGESADREAMDAALESLKLLCNLNPQDRRSRQEATFACKYGGKKYKGVLATQGTKSGERVVLTLEGPKMDLSSLTSLGMRDKMLEQLQTVLRTPGFVLVSSMPRNGLSTTWAATLQSTDRMLRDFVSLEDEAKPTSYVENVEIITFNGAAGETPATLIPKQMLRQPDAVVIPELTDGLTVSLLAEEAANEERLVICGVRAKEAVEALLRVMLLKPENVENFVQTVKAVLNVRLVRRLCDTCKVGYVPPPQLVKQLGIPAGRVHELFREWKPNPEEQNKKVPPDACEFCGLLGPSCNGLAYRGRVAIFELLIVDDKLREALLKQPKLETLRKIACQSGHRTAKDEGVLMIARGITSLNELQRVLSQ
jgi:type II secretory ATPase GspE/PulE/Tfp pilus assembly ATPase PilB-like protein